MKLASYQDGSRDGQLLVVSRDLATAHFATGIATRMQQVLDDWNFLSPQLEDLSCALNQGRARHAFRFDPRKCMAPLPRGAKWVGSRSYPHHLALLGAARGGAGAAALGEPPMYLGGSGDFLGPCDDIAVSSEKMGIDFEAGLAVITGDIAQGSSPDQSLAGVRLLMLVNEICLRHVMDNEVGRGYGWLQGRPATAFSPVAVTPDEAGAAWQDGRLHLTLQTRLNGERIGRCEAGPEMAFHFGDLLAHLAKTRRVRAGTVVGSGPISNEDRRHGSSCLAEKRAIEALSGAEPTSPFMRYGDTVSIDMTGRDGHSLFGAIDQTVTPAGETLARDS